MESFFAIWTTQDPEGYRCNTAGSLELVSDTLDNFRSSDAMKREWYGRMVLSLLTGNGDVHSENLSMLGDHDPVLAPVYDPAPMRAFRGRENHDLLSALPFTGIGGVASGPYRPYAESGHTPPDLGARLMMLGQHAGLATDSAQAELYRLLQITADFGNAAEDCLQRCLPQGYQGRAPDVAGFLATLSAVRRAVQVAV